MASRRSMQACIVGVISCLLPVCAIRVGDVEENNVSLVVAEEQWSSLPSCANDPQVKEKGLCCVCRQFEFLNTCWRPMKKIPKKEVPFPNMAIRRYGSTTGYKKPAEWKYSLCCEWRERHDGLDASWNNAKCYGYTSDDIAGGAACTGSITNPEMREQGVVKRVKQVADNLLKGAIDLSKVPMKEWQAWAKKKGAELLAAVKPLATWRGAWKATKVVGGITLVVTAITCPACTAALAVAGVLWVVGKSIVDAILQYHEIDEEGERVNTVGSIAAHFIFNVVVGGVLAGVGLPNTLFGVLDGLEEGVSELTAAVFEVLSHACNLAREALDGAADYTSTSVNIATLPPKAQKELTKKLAETGSPAMTGGEGTAVGEETVIQASCGAIRSIHSELPKTSTGEIQPAEPAVADKCIWLYGNH